MLSTEVLYAMGKSGSGPPGINLQTPSTTEWSNTSDDELRGY